MTDADVSDLSEDDLEDSLNDAVAELQQVDDPDRMQELNDRCDDLFKALMVRRREHPEDRRRRRDATKQDKRARRQTYQRQVIGR